MRLPYFLIYISIILITNPNVAQNKYYDNEYSSGYRGTYLKNINTPDSALSFLVIGDWGRCGEYFQKEVAGQLSNASISTNASFVISTGDNFYPKGVSSVDDPLWNKSFEDVYHHYALQKDWYVVLGNHDYKSNPQAEVDYSKKSTRWHMPSRYYSVKLPIDGDTSKQILFVFIDTSPLIDKYYNDKEYGKPVKTQDTSVQSKWLIKTLSDPDPSIRWKMVIGHHPMYSSGKRINSTETLQLRKRMASTFEKYKVDAYICGHEHQLEYIKPAGRTHHFISGAGSEIREVKGNLSESKFKVSDHGFLSFSVTKRSMKVYMINWEGKILYEQAIDHL